jgi:hypothetical protein
MRAVYIALMGDPTLRMDPVSPPGALNATAPGQGATLNWRASTDAVLGYHVYRGVSPSGPFSRLTGSPVIENTFTDTTAAPQVYTYMVRAVTLQTTPSGSYYNASQGAFATIDVADVALPIQLSVARTENGLMLGWNCRIGAFYRVLATANPDRIDWLDVSGSITATGSSASWTDTELHSLPRRFYQIASP